MTPEQKVVFAVAPRSDGRADVLLGIPRAAWDYMADGHTHTFDLTLLGLPLRIIMYGGPDPTAVRGWIAEHNKKLGITEVQDRTDEDFGI